MYQESSNAAQPSMFFMDEKPKRTGTYLPRGGCAGLMLSRVLDNSLRDPRLRARHKSASGMMFLR